jgi:hypothetical protein
LSFIEFAYNHSMHSTTDYSPFKIVYSFIPLTPLYFIILLLMKGLVLMVKKKKTQVVKNLHTKIRQ